MAQAISNVALTGNCPGAILKEIGVDLSRLSQFEVSATMIKARRLFQMHEANERLFAQIRRLELVRDGGGGLPPNTKVLMKVVDGDTSQTTILKISPTSTAKTITADVVRVFKRVPVLSVHVSRTRTAQLTSESLQLADGSICREEQTGLVIIAI
jgi:hypothetical protein